jgi:maltooligosyltrehalose trehalohydrolase
MPAAQRTRHDPIGTRRLPIGAEALDGEGVHFRVWAPEHAFIDLVLESGPGAPDPSTGSGQAVMRMEPEDEGYHAVTAPEAVVGTRYRFRPPNSRSLADPASRFQPDGPHGPSEVVDPSRFAWTDDAWPGLALQGQVLYEMHVGTFTREGSWKAAMRHLPALAELGITAIEMMPVADFPGRFGWGYDGVSLFAPTRLYGAPDDLRAFVNAAHGHGIGVLLDVVYNHFGPDGSTLREFSTHYLSKTHRSEWGESPNFDGEHSGPVREFFLANATHWIDEFHFDGFRLDATQSIHDGSKTHILVELGDHVRRAAGRRRTLIVNENEPQRTMLVRPVEKGGYGLDMIWNDDWHHSATVAATAQDEAYYTDYRGTSQELVSAAKYGFLYQGQWYRWQRQRRGDPAFDIEPHRFVHFLENHDQVANSGDGRRPATNASAGRWRALTALLLLGPQTPMLFQGQEFDASSPFVFFADHHGELSRLVSKGRSEFMAQFANLAQPEVSRRIPQPHEPNTFERCKLDHDERTKNVHAFALHRDLIRLRKHDSCLAALTRPRPVDGAVFGRHAFVLRFFGHDDDDRLLMINLGSTLHLDPAPEPLLAPTGGGQWRIKWSSQDPAYGGIGTLHPDAPETDRMIPNRPTVARPWENWRVQGETALLLEPVGAPEKTSDR